MCFWLLDTLLAVERGYDELIAAPEDFCVVKGRQYSKAQSVRIFSATVVLRANS